MEEAHTFSTTAEALAYFEAQGKLAPGEQGFWKVWGASVRDIRSGDLIAAKGEDGEPAWDLVNDVFVAKAAPLRYGIIVNGDERITLGALCPVVVVRWGTHNVLADSVH